MLLGLHENIESETRKLVITSGNYHAKVVAPLTPEYAVCLRLRHTYFVSTRGWVSCTGTMQETDHYDPYCQHLAVFHNTQILAYLRLLPWQAHTGFMLEHDFSCLLTSHEQKTIVHESSAELSRLVVNDALDEGSKIKAVELLFKFFYQTAQQCRYQHFYIVVEPSWLRLCRSRFGFHFTPIGPIHAFPDGTRTVAAYASLSDLERSMQEYSLEKFRWYATLNPVPAEIP